MLSWFLLLDFTAYPLLTWGVTAAAFALAATDPVASASATGAALLVVFGVLWCCCAPVGPLIELVWRPKPARDPIRRALLPQTRAALRRRAEELAAAEEERGGGRKKRQKKKPKKDKSKSKAKTGGTDQRKRKAEGAKKGRRKVKEIESSGESSHSAADEITTSSASEEKSARSSRKRADTSESSTSASDSENAGSDDSTKSDSNSSTKSDSDGSPSGPRTATRRRALKSSQTRGGDRQDGAEGDSTPRPYRRRISITYRPEYNITAYGLERLHPFDAAKYGRVIALLHERGIATSKRSSARSSAHDSEVEMISHAAAEDSQIPIVRAPVLPRSFLAEAHSAKYLASLHSALYLLKILEVPPVVLLPAVLTRWRVLSPMLFQCGGSCAAAELAVITQGAAINIGGGFHHASRAQGSGFCPFADITMIVNHVRAVFPEVRRCLVVDLDAHQGNGHERDAIEDDEMFVYDLFNETIFPGDMFAKKGIDFEHGVDYYDSDDLIYLELLRSSLPECIKATKPDLIIYNAGTDCLEGDPLGSMQVTADGIVERDRLVFDAALKRDTPIPLVMLLSGGYQMSNAGVIARSIENLVTTA
jgi:histone deacetylase 11